MEEKKNIEKNIELLSPTGDLVYIPSLDELIVGYIQEELPEGVKAFMYYETEKTRAAGKHQWAHVDELRRLAALHTTYKSMAYTAREKKRMDKTPFQK